MEAQSPLTPKLQLQKLNLFNETLFRVRIRGQAKVAHPRPHAHNQCLCCRGSGAESDHKLLRPLANLRGRMDLHVPLSERRVRQQKQGLPRHSHQLRRNPGVCPPGGAGT